MRGRHDGVRVSDEVRVEEGWSRSCFPDVRLLRRRSRDCPFVVVVNDEPLFATFELSRPQRGAVPPPFEFALSLAQAQDVFGARDREPDRLLSRRRVDDLLEERGRASPSLASDGHDRRQRDRDGRGLKRHRFGVSGRRGR